MFSIRLQWRSLNNPDGSPNQIVIRFARLATLVSLLILILLYGLSKQDTHTSMEFRSQFSWCDIKTGFAPFDFVLQSFFNILFLVVQLLVKCLGLAFQQASRDFLLRASAENSLKLNVSFPIFLFVTSLCEVRFIYMQDLASRNAICP